MKYKTFEKVIKLIKAQYAKEREFEDALKKVMDGWPILLITNNMIQALEILVTEIYQDKFAYENIEYFLEQKEGDTSDKMWEKDGTVIPMNTTKDLWNYLESLKGEQK